MLASKLLDKIQQKIFSSMLMRIRENSESLIEDAHSLFSEMQDYHDDRVIITLDNSTYQVTK